MQQMRIGQSALKTMSLRSTGEECKVKARQAAAQAGADFDQVWPRTVTRSLDVD